MLKRERLLKIIDKVNTNGIITVNEIMQHLKVSDMTARRDLDELEKAGKLVRIHGGAQSISSPIKKIRKIQYRKIKRANEREKRDC